MLNYDKVETSGHWVHYGYFVFISTFLLHNLVPVGSTLAESVSEAKNDNTIHNTYKQVYTQSSLESQQKQHG